MKRFLNIKLGSIFLIILFYTAGFSQTIELTEEEKEWIANNPEVTFGYDPDWKPVEYIDVNGNYSGISSDFLKLLSEKTGLKFRKLQNTTWSGSVDSVQNGKCDMLLALAESDSRKAFLDFTKPYLEYPFVIINRKKSEVITSLEDLNGKKVALPKGYYITEVIEKEYPDIDIVYTKDIQSNLMLVSTNKVFATVGNLGTIGYYLNAGGFQDLQIATETKLDKLGLAMATAKNKPILLSIVGKGLAAITEQERTNILNNWGSVNYEYGVDMAKVWRIAAISGGVVILIILLIVTWNRTLKKEIKARKVAELKLSKSFEEIRLQKDIIEERNQEVMDSIRYAKRIQEVILPTEIELKQSLKNYFVLYMPKDIVAGDFYWLQETDDRIHFASCDCTGHGVPGAMVSVVCSNSLNKAVKEIGINSPEKILDQARHYVVQRLGNNELTLKDGMDASLASLHKDEMVLDWAGANNPLWILREGEDKIIEFKGDKQPVGAYSSAKDFTKHTVQLQKKDRVFLFTDGYADQFGGPSVEKGGKKLKTSAFRKLLLENRELSMDELKEKLEKFIIEWRGSFEQLDDICIVSVEV